MEPAVPTAIQRMHVTDVDFHTTEKEEDLLPYLDAPYDRLAGASNPNRGSVFPSPGYVTPYTLGKIEPKTVRSPEQVYEGMKLFGLDEVVLSPSRCMDVTVVHHDDLSHELARAYDRWLLDTFLDEDSIYGSILVSPKKPSNAAELIDDLRAESGMVGVMVPNNGAVPLLGNERYDPIYDAAQRADLPVMMHPSGAGPMVGFAPQWASTSRFTEMKTSFPASDYMFTLSSLLMNGVPVRYPDLSFVVEEAGLGWIPYFMERIDHVFHGNEHDAPLLNERPSEYVRDRFYFTSQPAEGTNNRDYIEAIVDLLGGAERLMFSTDYPHKDFDSSAELYRGIHGNVSEEATECIYGGTARNLFLE